MGDKEGKVLEIVQVSMSDPQLLRLIDLLDAFQTVLYPPESNNATPPQQMKNMQASAWLAKFDGESVGCACLVVHQGLAEIKRVYVDPNARGAGIASALIRRLEEEARARHLTKLWLETGVRQPAAIALYEKLGYRHTAAFGNYGDDPLGVYMVKGLA